MDPENGSPCSILICNVLEIEVVLDDKKASEEKLQLVRKERFVLMRQACIWLIATYVDPLLFT
jgi:hypothetical protein